MLSQPRKRVVSVAPLPPEKCAYALARYSRSPDSIRQSLEWVRAHDSQKFLEHYYFQYGHASIADLGHVVICFEGISELAAIEIEDEPLWDGQAKSSRYQDFSKTGFVTPSEISGEDARRYEAAAQRLLEAYTELHGRILSYLREKLPRPAEMKPEAYARNLAARAFDVARYLLFLGVPTNVGQVTSIRTLEKQIRRLKASEYAELREVAEEIVAACAAPPDCLWDPGAAVEPLAPTLARHVDADCYWIQVRRDLRAWAEQNLPAPSGIEVDDVDLLRPEDTPADIVATLLYPVTDRPFRELYELARSWSAARRAEVLDLAVRSRRRRDELSSGFRGNLYVFDIVTDLGAYRDLHRHRRCQQFRQAFTTRLGFDTPALLEEAGLAGVYQAAIETAVDTVRSLPEPAAHYLIPFGARVRFLLKMDFAEADYIARLRSGVKGHFSYRQVAWRMKQKMEEVEPELGRLIEATPPWVEDPLTR
ncbi:MAG: FAD-dependent thymidylate synthase [Bryobacterales bacterium]|nr:FAD-dependent thymidylate synthase [Bryobacteraceae bacterium]MDW8355317.1 FAD-dependent thymidylate synthase [Bryobacterales bacterium]